MNDKIFDSPVIVKDGNYLRHISDLSDAWEFLEDWPKNQRNGFYEIAQSACASGFSGRMTLAAAREGFVAWAKSAGILGDVSDTLPWMIAGQSGRGGIAA